MFNFKFYSCPNRYEIRTQKLLLKLIALNKAKTIGLDKNR